MPENIQQIVVQITSAPFVRALAQYGGSLLPSSQQEIPYDTLTDEEKAIWDAFIVMIENRYNANDVIATEFAAVTKRLEELQAMIGQNQQV